MSYSELVKNLTKSSEEIQNTLTNKKIDLMHMALGISGEAGEVVDLIKKVIVYNKSVNIPELIKELGDIEYYLEGLRQAIGISREEIIQSNIEKLSKRYSTGIYSDKQAIDRKDKA